VPEPLCRNRPLSLADEIPQIARPRLMMRHEEELMPAVELHDAATRQSFLLQSQPPVVTENLRHKVLAKPRIIEPAFLFYRQVWKTIRKTRCKESAAVPMQKAGTLVDLDALHAATGRASLQNVAAQSLMREAQGLNLRPLIHPFGMIESG